MHRELLLLMHAVWMGVVLLALYDVLRILRRLIPHRSGWIAAQDLCYCAGGALYVFARLYQENYGMIRCFVFAGILLGMLCYHYTLSPFLVGFFVRFLTIPVKYSKRGIKRLLFGIKRCRILICRRVKTHIVRNSGKKVSEIEKIRKDTEKIAEEEPSGDA